MAAFTPSATFALPRHRLIIGHSTVCASPRRLVLPRAYPCLPAVKVTPPSAAADAPKGASPPQPGTPPERKPITTPIHPVDPFAPVAEAAASAPSGVVTGGNNNNGDGNSGGGSGDDADGDSSPPPQKDFPFITFPRLSETANKALNSRLNTLYHLLQTFLHKIKVTFDYIVTHAPPRFLGAIVTALSTISGIRIKANYDERSKRAELMEAAYQQQMKMEQALRQSYDALATPVLQAAAKLASRLHLLVDMRWDSAESPNADPMVSAMYSTYLVARYFATVEVVKTERPLLDYGFPAADRILYNIIGRIQGIFCAGDAMLRDMQLTENFFKPEPGSSPLPAGLLRVSPRQQAIMGELLLRSAWLHNYKFLDGDVKNRHGLQAIMSFREFGRLYDGDSRMHACFEKLVEDFSALEAIARTKTREERRCATVGARIYFVQSALLDMVEFFDPLPDTRTVPLFRRRRVQISPHGDGVTQRFPLSLRLLYQDLAAIRDHKGVVNTQKRLGDHNAVEVYVAGRGTSAGGALAPTDVGECPLSQRVLLVLNEMGIPHRTISVAPDRKPAWYYLLHPDNRTPLLYHRGQVLDDPSYIILYLKENFPNRVRLASADHLDLRMNTKGLTKFHPHFLRWLNGDEEAKKTMERELRNLDGIFQFVKKKNNGKLFFGGNSFSSEDTALVPYLHHIDVAGRVMMEWRIPVELKALNSYLAEARKKQSFLDTVPSNDSIVEGYTTMLSEGSWKFNWRLADLL